VYSTSVSPYGNAPGRLTGADETSETPPLQPKNEQMTVPSFHASAEPLHRTLSQAVRSHQRGARTDSIWHNGGTMLALAATTTATVLPTAYSGWARAAAGLATFLIALARALDFGTRWRWHLNMRSRYQVLLDKTEQVLVLPADEQGAVVRQIYDELAKVRTQERAIPGTGTPGTSSPNA
jgi:hypothetical protein